MLKRRNEIRVAGFEEPCVLSRVEMLIIVNDS